MAFSDFKTVPEVQEKFGIRYTETDFLKVEAPMELPSEQFLQELEFSRQYIDVFASEAARCETIIFPILKEVYKTHAEDYALWIKRGIAYDETLNGTPDYFISKRSELGILVVGNPLIILAEAKKNDFGQGWGQCLAELVAAQKINDTPTLPVYGIVTDSTLWQFGRLVETLFTRNRTSFSLDNLPELFAALEAVFNAATQTP